MKHRSSILAGLAILAAVFTAAAGDAAETPDPLATLKAPVEKVLAILKDPQYADGQAQEAQQQAIRAIVTEVFDFLEISKRALARKWLAFSPDERRQFTDNFTELLLNTYTGQIQGDYTGEEVEFNGQEMLSKTKASVKSTIFRNNVETPVAYSMINRKGTWRVYDIQVEGISLVGNYRSQFRKILSKETPAQLIARIAEKNAAFNTNIE